MAELGDVVRRLRLGVGVRAIAREAAVHRKMVRGWVVLLGVDNRTPMMEAGDGKRVWAINLAIPESESLTNKAASWS